MRPFSPNRWTLLFLLYASPSAANVSLPSETNPIALALGEQHRLGVAAGTRFSVGNPEVLQVKNVHLGELGAALLVRGKRTGFSDLIVISGAETKTLRFQIVGRRDFASSAAPQSSAWQTVLRRAPGIDLVPGAGKTVVRGEAKSADDLNLVDALALPSQGPIEKLLRLNPVARRAAESRIRALLAEAGLERIRVQGAGSRVWLEGEVFSKFEEALAMNLAREVVRTIESRIQMPFESQPAIRFKVRILELSKLQSDSIGMLWSNSVPGIISLHQRLLKGNISLDATLNLLARSGRARLLSEPIIVLNAQGVAELRVGGEFPVPVKTKFHNSITWKPYGLRLHIEVPGAAANLVRAKVGVAVSSIDLANSIDGIPAVKLNQMDTTIDLSNGKPVFISGLIDASQSEAESAIPGLGKIPVLGALFRSREFLERRSELVMAITAELGESVKL